MLAHEETLMHAHYLSLIVSLLYKYTHTPTNTFIWEHGCLEGYADLNSRVGFVRPFFFHFDFLFVLVFLWFSHLEGF